MQKKKLIISLIVAILSITMLIGVVACNKNTNSNVNGDPNPVDSKDLIDVSSFLNFQLTSPTDYENRPTRYVHEKIDYPHGYYTCNLEIEDADYDDNDTFSYIPHVLRVDDFDTKATTIKQKYGLDKSETPSDEAGFCKDVAILCKNTTLTIPDTYKGLPVIAFGCYQPLYELNLSKNARFVDVYVSPCNLLSRITVPADNPYFRVEDNCLISKTNDYINEYEENQLIVASTYTQSIPTSVTSIGRNAFCMNIGVDSITIPSTVKRIDQGAFMSIYKSITLYPETELTNGCFDCLTTPNIHYQGTKAQWHKMIETAPNPLEIWEDVNSYTVYCTDGNLIMPVSH